jgi:eukaryotic-like serine/threonine-protein kinase
VCATCVRVLVCNSLGCMLFELLTGKVPYSAAMSNDLLNKHFSAPIPAVDAINKNATTRVAHLIRQTLGKAPADRPKSMKDVLQQLRTIRFFERAITL